MSSRSALGSTYMQWVPAALSSGVKSPGYEADHSPTNAEFKNVFMA
jgi:hypothetical protein